MFIFNLSCNRLVVSMEPAVCALLRPTTLTLTPGTLCPPCWARAVTLASQWLMTASLWLGASTASPPPLTLSATTLKLVSGLMSVTWRSPAALWAAAWCPDSPTSPSTLPLVTNCSFQMRSRKQHTDVDPSEHELYCSVNKCLYASNYTCARMFSLCDDLNFMTFDLLVEWWREGGKLLCVHLEG